MSKRLFFLLLCGFVIPAALPLSARTRPPVAPASVKVHGIFRSHMVLQRDEPIAVWGWAPKGGKVLVTLGEESGESTARGETGRWEVRFDPRPATSEPQSLSVSSGGSTMTMRDILIGDVWVMNGQSNMAFGLKTLKAEAAEALATRLGRGEK